MNRVLATFLAAAAAPVTAAVALGVAAVMQFGEPASNAFFAVLLFYPFAFVAELLLGGPLLVLAWRLKLIRWWSATIGGGLVAFVIALALQPSQLGALGAHAAGWAMWTATGAASGLTFWLVWRLGKDAAPATPHAAPQP